MKILSKIAVLFVFAATFTLVSCGGNDCYDCAADATLGLDAETVCEDDPQFNGSSEAFDAYIALSTGFGQVCTKQ